MPQKILIELGKIEKLAVKFRKHLAHAEMCDALHRNFQSSYTQIFELLSGHAVKKYVFKPSNHVVWIVKGRERDYLIIPEAPYCHCMSFYIHVINGQSQMCYHLAAQRIASALNIHETIEESDKLFQQLKVEWTE